MARSILALPALATGQAAAQTASRIDQAIAAQTTIVERFTPPPTVGSVEIAVEDQRRRVTDSEAERVHLRLQSLTVEGADTLRPEALAPIWRDLIGQDITLADLFGIAARIDDAYRRAGYLSMTIVPVQELGSGNVRLRVYESYLASVEIRSAIPGIERRLAPYIERIVAMRPIRLKDAERILLLMDDLGGLDIEGTLVRPEVPTGGGKLVLNVAFDRSSGLVGLDNLGNDSVGPLELSANVVLNDLVGLFETTSVVAVTVPDSPREMAFLQASQDIPIGHDGLTAGYAFTYVAQEPGGDLAPLGVEVETRLGSGYVSYPFIRTLDQSLFGQIEFNARDDDVDVGGRPAERSRARWLLASLHYDRDLNAGGLACTFSLGQGLGHGLDRDDIPDDYRFAAADIDYDRALGERTGLQVRAAGQYAATPLPAAVSFTLGGDPYGWAFDGGTLSGDSGAATAIELRRAVDTGLDSLGTLSITAIADYGIVWNHDVAADYARSTLGSVGIGVSGILRDRMMFQVLAAAPWTTGDFVDDPGTRLFFRIGVPL